MLYYPPLSNGPLFQFLANKAFLESPLVALTKTLF